MVLVFRAVRWADIRTMRRRLGRVRRWARVAAMAAFLCLAMAEVISTGHRFRHTRSDAQDGEACESYLWVRKGTAGIGYEHYTPPTTTTLGRTFPSSAPISFLGIIEYQRWGGQASGFTGWQLDLHLFWPMAACGLISVLAWWQTRRVRAYTCANCSYDLRGLTANRPCPECGISTGHAIDAPATC